MLKKKSRTFLFGTKALLSIANIFAMLCVKIVSTNGANYRIKCTLLDYSNTTYLKMNTGPYRKNTRVLFVLQKKQ